MLKTVLVAMAVFTASAATDPPASNPDRVLHDLLAGNARYRMDHPRHPHQKTARRAEVAKAQHPPTVVLGCADSRVPPEVVFDQGLGDLFVVRVAGNVVDDDVLGSIEYAVEHLGSTLIIVLGHERCGAVSAAVEGGAVEGHVGKLVEAIQPAVDETRGKPGDPIENAIRANIRNSVSLIEHDEPILTHATKAGKVKVVGARYGLGTGAVEIVH